MRNEDVVDVFVVLFFVLSINQDLALDLVPIFFLRNSYLSLCTMFHIFRLEWEMTSQ